MKREMYCEQLCIMQITDRVVQAIRQGYVQTIKEYEWSGLVYAPLPLSCKKKQLVSHETWLVVVLIVVVVLSVSLDIG